MMATCGQIVGLILLVTTNLAIIIGFATPYWVEYHTVYKQNQGLWATCHNEDCTWVFDDDFSSQRSRPEKKRRCARRQLVAPQEVIPVHPNPVQDLQPQPIDGECEHCFQSPCVTTRQFIWLGQGQRPGIENSGLRKDRYGRYWKIMANLGGWNDPRYLHVKTQRANGEYAVHHRREIMPVCILQQIRNLL